MIVRKCFLNGYRIPGSRARGKDNPREGKGTRRKGHQREENIADVGDRSGEGDNYQPQEAFGSREGGKYQDIWGVRPWAFAIRGKVLRPQVIWIGGNWGTMVPIERRGDIWKIAMVPAIMRI